ncbi:hypothetical protein GCM10007857_77510 [Bradyrhizobium iriomotense]|uniref:Transposase n=1 Tax=Bradyrhizobium iriomotense TaxID=441950 RepID=A0ABQ6BBH5_9BRAD|nr:hypothetical protein GCM10007857_77510 [Bradyrhizobium iriomotense]
MPVGKPDCFGDAGNVEKKIAGLKDALGDPPVELVDDVPGGSCQRAIEGSEQSFRRSRYGLQDAHGATVLGDGGTDRTQEVDCSVNGLNGSLLIAGSGLKCEAAMVEGNKDGVWSRPVERGVRMQRVLQKLIVGARDTFEREAMACCRCGQDRDYEVESAISDQAQPEGSQRLQGVSLLAG